MEFKKRPQSSVPVLQRLPQLVQAAQPAPGMQRQALIQRDLQRHTTRPTTVQRQVAAPALKVAALHTAEVQRLSEERLGVQRQAAEIGLPQSAVDAALQRQQAVPAPVPTKPQSISDWVTVMRFQADQAEGRRMGAKEAVQFTALQRQVAQTMSRSYLTDRQSAVQRQQDYAGHVVALQRHPVSGQVARAFMLSVPQGERAALQRAVDEVSQHEALQRQQDEQALKLHTLQRQLAELDQQATQPVFERIQQRRGAGNPLPEAIQRHLEQGLNHDLSAVRIHDDAEADKLAKGMNAIAFTTGTDIYFQSGKFNPNSQSGLELLAHEVTHTVQQSKGQVGKGVDPDSGLESEARAMGRALASKRVGTRALRANGKRLSAKKSESRSAFSIGYTVQRQTQTSLAPVGAAGGRARRNAKQNHSAADYQLWLNSLLSRSWIIVPEDNKRINMEIQEVANLIVSEPYGRRKNILEFILQRMSPSSWQEFKPYLIRASSMDKEFKGSIDSLGRDNVRAQDPFDKYNRDLPFTNYEKSKGAVTAAKIQTVVLLRHTIETLFPRSQVDFVIEKYLANNNPEEVLEFDISSSLSTYFSKLKTPNELVIEAIYRDMGLPLVGLLNNRPNLIKSKNKDLIAASQKFGSMKNGTSLSVKVPLKSMLGSDSLLGKKNNPLEDALNYNRISKAFLPAWIAGGAGSGDKKFPDLRVVDGGEVGLTLTKGANKSALIKSSNIRILVQDTFDFSPGQIGDNFLTQKAVMPINRYEASGYTTGVRYRVRYLLKMNREYKI